MTLKNNTIANYIKKLIRESVIVGEQPWYDLPKALEKIENDIQDPLLKSKVLDMVHKGYCVIENSVDTQKIDQALESYLAWKERNKNELKPFMRNDIALDRIINIHNTLKEFGPLFTANTALKTQDYLFQKETALYTSLFFEQGSTQGIHRDIPVFWTNPGCQYFGTWLAMEDTDGQNGPLIVMKGGHKLPLLDREKIGYEFYKNLDDIPPQSEPMWNRYQTEVREQCTKNNLVEEQVHVKKGDTIIWHPLLPHGGAPILDWSKTRYSFVVHTTPVNTPVFHQNVFFNPKKSAVKKALWGYDEINDRKIAQTGPLSIGHGSTFDFSKLV